MSFPCGAVVRNGWGVSEESRADYHCSRRMMRGEPARSINERHLIFPQGRREADDRLDSYSSQGGGAAGRSVLPHSAENPLPLVALIMAEKTRNPP